MLMLLLVIFLPLFSLSLLPLKDINRLLFYGLQLLMALGHLFASLTVPMDSSISFEHFPLAFEIDQYSKMFVILISVAWILSIFFTYEYNKDHFLSHAKEFFKFLFPVLTVNIMNATAGNLITLVVFYLIGIALTYPLLKIKGDEVSKKASKSYLYYTILPVLFLVFPAMGMTYHLTGDLAFEHHSTFLASDVPLGLSGLILTMFILGFSLNCIFPFHKWLPGTYVAPSPVSALVHSVVSVKTASIASIKIVVYILGLDYVKKLTSSMETGGYLILFAGLTAVYTAYLALKTDNLKERFSYSTVGQLSYIVLAILIGTKTGIVAASLHIITHAIAKSTLFYVVGFYSSVYGLEKASQIGKIVPNTKPIAFVVAICGLSITGFPFLAGYYSKDLMLLEELHTGNYLSSAFLLLGSIINLFYIFPVVKNIIKKPDPNFKAKPIPRGMIIVFSIAVLAMLTSSFYMHWISKMIE
ncbi:MAG: proton-conducting transporter membrane subunit [Cytophagales bacterium]